MYYSQAERPQDVRHTIRFQHKTAATGKFKGTVHTSHERAQAECRRLNKEYPKWNYWVESR